MLNDLKEVKAGWIKFGKVGDWIRGTLADVREMDSQMKPGEKVKVYEFVAQGGAFHYFKKESGAIVVDPEPTILDTGSIWIVGGKPGIDDKMRNVKIGQIFGMRFQEEKPNKKNPSYNPTKVIKVLVGEMDKDYHGQTAADVETVSADQPA